MSNQPLRFVKYHGTGNDFIVVQEVRLGVAQVKAWCDRRRGIGADGVLVRRAANDSSCDVGMQIWNADGSRAEMCGNGLRCFARWLVEYGELGEASFFVETDAGPRWCTILERAHDEWVVEVGMGVPSFTRAQIPMTGAGAASGVAEVNGGLAYHGVSMGNPHMVVLVEEPDTTLALARAHGPRLSKPGEFREGANVGFACVRGTDQLELSVYERGSGITQACGSGAAAAVAVGHRLGLVSAGEVAVDLPGGRLHVRHGASGEMWLRGPAVRVYEGALRASLGAIKASS